MSERKQAAGKAQVHCARAINGHQRLSLLYPFTPARTFMVQARLMKVLSNGLCFSRPPWGWDPVSGLKMMGLRQEMRRSKLCEYVHYQKQGISSLQAAQKGVGGLPTSYWVGLIGGLLPGEHTAACNCLQKDAIEILVVFLKSARSLGDMLLCQWIGHGFILVARSKSRS